MTAVMFESDTKTNTAPTWLSWSKPSLLKRRQSIPRAMRADTAPSRRTSLK